MTFENLKETEINKLNLALFILYTFLALVAVFIPMLGVAGIILLPVPATILVAGGRIRDGIICAITGCIALVFMDFSLMLIMVILVIAISFIYKDSIDRDRSNLHTAGCIFTAFCIAVILYILINSLVYRINFIDEFIKNYNASIDIIFGDEFFLMYTGLFPADESQLKIILEQLRNILEFMLYIVPGFLIFLCSFMSVINYMVTSRVLVRYGINLKPLKSFKDWDIPWYYCWTVILGLVLVLIPFNNQSLDNIANITGFNLLIIFGSIYLVLGISVIWSLMEKFKVPLVWRIIIFILIALFSGFMIFILSFMGLIDVWVNFRKLERGKQIA
ncbi:MAG: DUF2232 domain-containing protein [Actinomycetota bacterium]|nr:DUF2232 domain-containing protein [Actinomycetota bacterium]